MALGYGYELSPPACFCTGLLSDWASVHAHMVSDTRALLLQCAGLFDPDKEIARLRKQQQKLAGDLAGVDNRLGNKSFVAKAPDHVVAETRRQRDEVAQRLSLVEEKLQQMQDLAMAPA